MKHSKRDRETAAIICGARSSMWTQFSCLQYGMPDIYESLGASNRSVRLALAAFQVAFDHLCFAPSEITWAEAEAMILDGWEPG